LRPIQNIVKILGCREKVIENCMELLFQLLEETASVLVVAFKKVPVVFWVLSTQGAEVGSHVRVKMQLTEWQFVVNKKDYPLLVIAWK